MQFRKIVGPITIFSGSSGGVKEYRLDASSGGRVVKSVNYQLKVLAASATSDIDLSVVLNHGPDGLVSTLHSTAINAADPGSTFPMVLSGDIDSTKTLSEYLHPIIKIEDTGAVQAWVTVELYEMRKPF